MKWIGDEALITDNKCLYCGGREIMVKNEIGDLTSNMNFNGDYHSCKDAKDCIKFSELSKIDFRYSPGHMKIRREGKTLLEIDVIGKDIEDDTA